MCASAPSSVLHKPACVVRVSVPFTELHEHAYTVLILLWYECVLCTNKVFYILLLYHVLCMSVFPLVCYINVYVLCSGVKRVLFTNKLSECWCHIIKPYLFTKLHVSKLSDKRVTQTCPVLRWLGRVIHCKLPLHPLPLPISILHNYFHCTFPLYVFPLHT